MNFLTTVAVLSRILQIMNWMVTQVNIAHTGAVAYIERFFLSFKFIHTVT